MRMPENLRGAVSGKLVATAFVGQEVRGRAFVWKCRCQCGGHAIRRATQIKKRTTPDCGCGSRQRMSDRNRKHGLGRTPEAARWRAMVNRCHNQNNDGFHRYGGRGIWVCERWRNSFEAYLEDVGSVPDGMQVDREDNNAGYCCGKCEDCHSRGFTKPNWRVATVTTNQRNRSDNRLLTLNGVTRTMTEWSEATGIHVGTIWGRLSLGWSDERTLTTPTRRKER